MRGQLLAVCTSTCLLVASTLAQPAATRTRISHEERIQGFSSRAVLAKPRAGTTARALQAAESVEGRRVRRIFPRLENLRIIEPAAGEAIGDTITRLQATGRYEFVEPDYIRLPHALPDDPRFVRGEQWHLRNIGQDGGTPGADVGASAAWDVRTDAPDVIVAVIDTGIRQTHEDLSAILWNNPDEVPGNGIDDDGDGYVDDIHGINSLAFPGSPDSGNPKDDTGHGTKVAGVIAAAGNNARGISGLVWKGKIMALKFDDAEGASTISNEVECIDYAIAHGAKIINFSYGSFVFSRAEFEAVQRARDAGVIFVVSAGNEATSTDISPVYPANYLLDNLLTVAATDRRDALSDFSNYSEGLVDLAAPGSAIVTTNHTSDDGYSTHSGTSFSAPLVSGALALAKAQFPQDTYRELIDRLLGSVHPLPALAGRTQTGGRLDLARLLTSTNRRPFNDDFASRPQLSSLSLTLRAHSGGAAVEQDEPHHAALPARRTLWWSWTAPVSGPVAVETLGSTFDTILAVYTGSSLPGLAEVASNDDAPNLTSSRVSFSATAGTTYAIAVGSKSDEGGAVVLSLGLVPDNDDFADATRLSGLSLRKGGLNTVAGSEPGEPKPIATAHGRSVWYKWTAPSSETYYFSIFAYGFDAVGAVYTGSSIDTLTSLAISSSKIYNEPGSFKATAGATYYLQVDSADGASGYFNLTLGDTIPFSGFFPVDASPACSPATDYIASADNYGMLLFINPTTTDIKSGQLSGSLDVQSPTFGADGSMYIGDDYGYLYAYEPTTTRRWRIDLGWVRVTSSPAIGADGAIYVHTDDGFVYGLYADGTLKWRALVPGQSYSSPSIGADGTLYIGSDDEHLYALAPSDGTVKWRFKADGEIYASPAINTDGTLYFGTLNGNFYAVSAAGAERWHYATGAAISSSAAISSTGTLYFGCYDHYLYALNSDGTLRWRYQTGDEIRASSPAVATNGTIYIGSYDGFIHAVSPLGEQRRVFATGAYIRSSPLLLARTLLVGSGDSRLYVAEVEGDLAASPWPMHRQNVARTGRRAGSGAPTILASHVPQTVTAGEAVTLSVNAVGAEPLSFQWYRDGTAIAGATYSNYTIASAAATDAANYTVTVTGPSNSQASFAPAALAVAARQKVVGQGHEVGSDIYVATNRNTFDQILLEGGCATITADPAQITRVSYVDLNDDIVQVEFSGAGTLTLALDTPTGPATPVNYNQSVTYMKGHARLAITGADERTNVAVFSVGRATAVNQALFKNDVTYDGHADIASITITSRNGRFGSIRTANARYSASAGITGIVAPGIAFEGPVFIGNVNASDAATPEILLGRVTDARITGGDLLQANGHSVEVSGLSKLRFTAGADSHGNADAAKTNAAVLTQEGRDVTAQIVVNP